jgi:hypothetical protein
MKYLADPSKDLDERRNLAFQVVVAMREMFTLAARLPQMFPYRRAARIIEDIDPDLGNDVSASLTRTNESDTVRYYRQVAAALREMGGSADEAELIQKAIDENRALLSTALQDNQILREVYRLEAALEHFKPAPFSEDHALHHDFTLAGRSHEASKVLYEEAKEKSYVMNDGRILRVQLLHPEPSLEGILGTDMIYEVFDLSRERVRFVHLQYKTWNKSTLTFSSGNLVSQLEKLDANLCQAGLCHSTDGSRQGEDYRMPYCSAFLRPTTTIGKPDQLLQTTGWHIPVCAVNKIRKTELSLKRSDIKDRTVSYKIFEEMMISNMIGSRWISFNELDAFYESRGILKNTNRIRVHAREVLPTSDAGEAYDAHGGGDIVEDSLPF